MVDVSWGVSVGGTLTFTVGSWLVFPPALRAAGETGKTQTPEPRRPQRPVINPANATEVGLTGPQTQTITPHWLHVLAPPGYSARCFSLWLIEATARCQDLWMGIEVKISFVQ